MVTISHLVEKIVNERPLLFQAMEQGIVSFANLAEHLEPEIEKELNKKVQRSAIVMALRRFSDKIKTKTIIPKFDFNSEIILKTHILDIAVRKSPELFKIFQKLQKIVDYQAGDTLNIINGNNEVSIVTNLKYLNKLKEILKDEKIIKIEKDLVALSLSFSEKFLYTPGVIATVVRHLTWENINIYELISTFTELTFIISGKEATKGYKVMEKIVKGL